MSHAVAPTLFEGLEHYARSIQLETIAIEDQIEAGSEIVAFLNGFFEQFFRGVLDAEIRGPSLQDKEDAQRLRASRGLPREQRTLVMQFEDYCDLSPDIYGSEYGGDSDLFTAFHTEFMVYLVEDIVAWAVTTGDSDLIAAARSARDAYTTAAA